MVNTDNKIIDQFIMSHPDQAINLIEDYGDIEIAGLLQSLPTPIGAKVLANIVSFKALKVLQHMDLNVASKIFSAMSLRKVGNLLLRCDKSLRDEILKKSSKEIKEAVEYRLNYAADTVGAQMDTGVLTLKSDHKIEDSLDLVKKNLSAVHPQLYVLNVQDELVGYVELKDLLTDQSDRNIHSLLKEKPMTFLPAMSIEELLSQWDSKFTQLPVVDTENVFLGVVTKQAILEYVGIGEIHRKPVFRAGSALSELYRIGFISLLGTSPESSLKNRLS